MNQKRTPIFYIGDFIALVCAVVILLAYLFMPWFQLPEMNPTSGLVATIGTAMPTLETNAFVLSGLFLIPLMGIISLAVTIWGMLVPRQKMTAIGVNFVVGLGTLIYYLNFLYNNAQNAEDLTGYMGTGFWLALFGATGLLLQTFIPRSEEDQQLPIVAARGMFASGIMRLVVSLVVPVVTFVVLLWSFTFMRDTEASKLVIAVVALVVGVGGVWVLYIVTNNLVEQFPEHVRDAMRPYVFVGPALVILMVYLLYPALETLRLSFFDARSVNFIGFENYQHIFTDPDMLVVLRNNILWIVLVTSFTVGLGLIIAVLVDRIGRWEPVAKSLIFVPMAISAVGASVIWRFMYDAKPTTQAQIGLLNAFNVNVLNMDPILYLINKSINNYALIIIMIWLLTGYCMVIISAAVKGVPAELLEAGRIDGANELNVFFQIIIPTIRPTLITVGTTIFIMVLKVFDIVYVMTNGRRDTEVVANRMFNEFFKYGNYGRGSALAIILLAALIPVIYSNVRDIRQRGM